MKWRMRVSLSRQLQVLRGKRRRKEVVARAESAQRRRTGMRAVRVVVGKKRGRREMNAGRRMAGRMGRRGRKEGRETTRMES